MHTITSLQNDLRAMGILPDDTLLFRHALLSKPGDRHKREQNLQIFLKFLGGIEEIPGKIGAAIGYPCRNQYETETEKTDIVDYTHKRERRE